MASFIKDVQEIRERAMQKLADGAVTNTYGLDADESVSILNEALATEIVCVLRYTHHYFMATGVHGRSVAKIFKEHADEEREHMDEIAERIQQLGGKPDFNPGTLVSRSVAQYVEGESLADMIREDLIAERMVIDVYQKMIEHFGVKDPTTRTLLEHIKAEEEEHADELSDILFVSNPSTGEDQGEDPGTDVLKKSRGSRRSPAAVGTSGAETPEEYELVEKTMAQRNNEESDNERDTVRLEGEEEAPASNIGGVSGRTMNRRKSGEDIEDTDAAEQANEGGMAGTNRSPKIMEKKRKNRVA